MIRLNCKVAALNAGLDTGVFQSADFSDLLQGHFRRASGEDIDLRVQWSPIPPLLPAGKPVIDGDLHFAMRTLTGNPSTPPIDTIGLLIASAYESDDLMFGLMFDQGLAQVPGDLNAAVSREGAVVFVDAIARRRTTAELQAECEFTSIHELGHAFNLGHAAQKPPSFMSRSALRSVAYDHEAYFFTSTHQDRLRTCSTDPLVRPGASPFSGLDFGNRSHCSGAAGNARLSLTVNICPAECTRFEPIHLDVTIGLKGSDASSIRLPRMLDPSHATFRIFIEEPDGQTRRYHSSTHCCGSMRRIEVSRARPYRRDIVILGEGGRYTFRKTGPHRIYIEFDVSRTQTLRSNTARFVVLPEPTRNSRWQEALSILKTPQAAELLQYRRTGNQRLLKRMSDMIDSWGGSWDERRNLIAYRWARTVLNSRASHRSTGLRKQAVRYLARCRHLRTHREERAEQMLTHEESSNVDSRAQKASFEDR